MQCILISLTLDSGLDFHVAGDANFSHRHNIAAGDCPDVRYDSVHQLEPQRLKAMEESLVAAGKRPTKAYKGGVSNEALDACQDSHF